MKAYYPSIKRAIAPLILLTLFFFSHLYGLYFTLSEGKPIYALILLLTLIVFLCLYYLVYRWYTSPVVSINGNQISIHGMFNREKVIEDLRICTLVLNEGSLYFRRENEQDIIVDKDDFPTFKWKTLIEELKRLPFTEIL